DLLGREAAHDKRSDTVAQFMSRYEVDPAQAARVKRAALAFYSAIATDTPKQDDAARTDGESAEMTQLLGWAADLHEAGLSIAHSGYHRHTSYILGNADMPGVSKSEQQLLALFGLGHHGKLNRPELQLPSNEHWRALLSLRLAAVLLRRREDFDPIPLTLTGKGKRFQASVSKEWLESHPLTEYSLRAEQDEWKKIGFELDFVET